eukprot:gene4495-8940_t
MIGWNRFNNVLRVRFIFSRTIAESVNNLEREHYNSAYDMKIEYSEQPSDIYEAGNGNNDSDQATGVSLNLMSDSCIGVMKTAIFGSIQGDGCTVFVKPFHVPGQLPPLSTKHFQRDKYSLISIMKDIVLVDNKQDFLLLKKEEVKLQSLLHNIEMDDKLSQLTGNWRDIDYWNGYLSTFPEENPTWSSCDISFIESYFYRSVVDAVNYVESDFDPFVAQKFNKLLQSIPFAAELTTRIPEMLDQSLPLSLEFLLSASLWGEKLELNSKRNEAQSEVTSGSRKKKPMSEAIAARRPYLLDDHTYPIVSAIEKLSQQDGKDTPRRVDVILGDAGAELVADLFMCHMLLQLGCCDEIVLHTKAYPMLVTAATGRDVISSIEYLSNPASSEVWTVRHFGDALRNHVLSGQMKIEDDFFWCQPTAFWDMPAHIKDRLSSSAMVFVKGDANYRRLLGDREWPLEQSAASVLSYWSPIPLCALRTCKSELGCGISPLAQARAAKDDPDWLVSGRWGVIQLGGQE